ncbi:speckle targeted PIP5K1A-regulated poly(A) polymerase [Episyrphus balteatus]|uniref:speckle targeted PIP5K1A-regulated poly(A) polymerase n=1 Tax=Episyrphus balteatus TaxID=286459 RepID=UPI002485B3A4|nr:speckle targeted PIP5K1A-regulated poly(A) polymerase [Episyrphus balteatus]XP_055841780.1 speckle targeted PIP5K1A-regulated poly(A) polymerase [Episyrphus balteatus]
MTDLKVDEEESSSISEEQSENNNSSLNLTDSERENLECKICHQPFETLQDVLKHELLNHSATKNAKKQPVNQLKRRVNAVLKTINAEDEKKFRQNLAEAISDCANGKELSVIFKKYLIDDDHLNCIYSRIHNCLQKELDRIGPYKIEPYGSVANGLALKSSDIDLHISSTTSKADPSIIYKNITRMLYRSKQFSDIVPIRKARVPIIKCVHIATGFNLDINTSEPYGIHNSEFINILNQADNRIYELMLFLKIWFKNMHIYGAFNMTNYCLVTLIIFYLQNSNPPVLASVKIIQRNSNKRFINGINFGLNLRGITMDSSQNIHQLIKGFFEFYSSFDFEKVIIAPYLGKVIRKIDFQNKMFKYPEYDHQLLMLGEMTGEPAEELKTDCSVCVQDMFCLNINIAKGLSATNVQYLKKCITMAHKKCCEPKISNKTLYKSLLVDIIDELGQMFPTAETIPLTGVGDSSLTFDIIPRKNEIKSLAKFADEPMNLNKLWAKEYISAIELIITEIYKVDITLLSPTENSKFKKIDESEELPLPCKWSISSSVDLWTGRQMPKSNVSFMEYQLAQTKKLHAERRQKSSFAVQFKGFITVTISKNFSSLHIEASSNEQLNKKNPLRKFFGALKCSMQNYNLKHRIHQLECDFQTKAKAAV